MTFGGGISFGGISAAQASSLAVAAMHKEIGYGVYRDTQYTELSPFTVAANQTVILPNNAGFKVESQLPSDVTTFYTPNDQRIHGTLLSDIHITCDLTIKVIDPDASYVRLDFDVGPDAAPNFVGRYERALSWGVGVSHPFSIALWAYCGASMIANGARMNITVDGAVEISSIALWVRRTRKGVTP